MYKIFKYIYTYIITLIVIYFVHILGIITVFALRVMVDFSKSRGFPFFIGKAFNVKHRKNNENWRLNNYELYFGYNFFSIAVH